MRYLVNGGPPTLEHRAGRGKPVLPSNRLKQSR
jgi:hypothetical protein